MQVVVGGQVRRDVQVGTAGWTYSAADKAEDAAGGGFLVRVAQVSDRFGPGPFREVWVEAG